MRIYKEGNIMLNTTKTVTLNGNSTIDGIMAEGYTASIDSANPENMSMSSWIADQKLYKAHRSDCRVDKAAFEDAAFALQDEMIAEKSSLQME